MTSIGPYELDESRLCEGTNRRGQTCKNHPIAGSHFCPYHDPEAAQPISSRWAAASEAYKRHLADVADLQEPVETPAEA